MCSISPLLEKYRGDEVSTPINRFMPLYPMKGEPMCPYLLVSANIAAIVYLLEIGDAHLRCDVVNFHSC